MKKYLRILVYYLLMAINFYVFPLLIQDTGSGIILLMGVMPLICLIISIIYGIRKGFNILYGIIVGIMFLPTVYIFLNESALIYCVIYGITAIIGNAVGGLFYIEKKKEG